MGHELHAVLKEHRMDLLRNVPVKGVEILSDGIFVLEGAPKVVFKIDKDLLSRWQDAGDGAKVCREKALDLLVVPRQSLLKVRIGGLDHNVIAEERLPLTNDFAYQHRLHRALSGRLRPTLQQLTLFIIASGFKDVDFRNIPIIDQGLAAEEIPRLALVDLENCGVVSSATAAKGNYDLAFFGNNWNVRGLFRCITPSNFDLVVDTARLKGLDLINLSPCKGYQYTIEKRSTELYQIEQASAILENAARYESEATRIVNAIDDVFPEATTESAVKTYSMDVMSEGSTVLAPHRFEARLHGANIG
ncbi:MAG: hypothetical protein EOO38_25705, partial [Cytophagaceae bacterium]